jgi:hypothetical protein
MWPVRYVMARGRRVTITVQPTAGTLVRRRNSQIGAALTVGIAHEEGTHHSHHPRNTLSSSEVPRKDWGHPHTALNTIKRKPAAPTKRSEITSPTILDHQSTVFTPAYKNDYACMKDDNLNHFELSG